jgi:predicted RNA-binding Zn-ribbon protein involved in translation (DUF1610 family)
LMMMTAERYRCPRCGDEMSLRFATSHERICRWSTAVEQRDVDTLLFELGLD